MCKEEKIKISIIVPVFMTELYLESCLDSLIGQTYTNIEIICICDGNGDMSYDICKKYSEMDDRFIVVHRETGDVSSARNMGLKLSTGSLITFVDADDWVEPEICGVALDLFKKHSPDVVIIGFDTTNRKKMSPAFNKDFLIWENERVDLLQLDLYSLYFDNQAQYYTRAVWGKFYTKELLRYMEFVNVVGDDSFFNLCAYENAHKICYKSTPMYHYRYISTSTSKSYRENILFLYVFFASTFWTKLQNIFGHCCMSKLDKVAKRWPVVLRLAI